MGKQADGWMGRWMERKTDEWTGDKPDERTERRADPKRIIKILYFLRKGFEKSPLLLFLGLLGISLERVKKILFHMYGKKISSK